MLSFSQASVSVFHSDHNFGAQGSAAGPSARLMTDPHGASPLHGAASLTPAAAP